MKKLGLFFGICILTLVAARSHAMSVWDLPEEEGYSYKAKCKKSQKSKVEKAKEKKEALVEDLCLGDAFKFGNFTLKSGKKSPIYIDFRSIISYPAVFESLTSRLCKKIKEEGIKFDVLCGVPYTALPMATAVAIEKFYPMVMVRKEAKNYGTNKMVEGKFDKGNRALIIEDVITTGDSVLEVAELLKKEGLEVKDILVCLDREQKGKESLKEKGYNVYALFTITEVLDVLRDKKHIDLQLYNTIKQYLCDGEQQNTENV